jgi:histidyl-tRNA synthetase
MLARPPEAAQRPVAVIPVGAEAEAAALRLARDLRHAGIAVELGFHGNLSRRMKHANKIGARAAIILGQDELTRGMATVRDLDSGAQEEMPLEAAALKLWLDQCHRPTLATQVEER